MSYEYTEVKKEYVFKVLGENKTVLCVDFNALRVMNCNELKVGAIQSFLEIPNAKFYERTEVVTSE